METWREIIGVIGAGTMGNGIAQVAARAGYSRRDARCEGRVPAARHGQRLTKSLQRDVA